MTNVNPRGPSQKYPSSSEPITQDPKGVDQGHQHSDLDSSKFAQHHTLGSNPNQASPGNHVHDGSNSKQFTDLEILNSLTVDGNFSAGGNASIVGLLTAGNLAWGQITLTPPTGGGIVGGNVSFNIKGTTFIGLATANTGVPGTTVLGVGINTISSTGATIWLNRNNATATGVFWLVIGI